MLLLVNLTTIQEPIFLTLILLPVHNSAQVSRRRRTMQPRKEQQGIENEVNSLERLKLKLGMYNIDRFREAAKKKKL